MWSLGTHALASRPWAGWLEIAPGNPPLALATEGWVVCGMTEKANTTGRRRAIPGPQRVVRYWPVRVQRWVAPVALAMLVGVIGLDVSHIGFFADDFHFLDVARRVPLLRAVDGHAGVYPWYRPLSRELYLED